MFRTVPFRPSTWALAFAAVAVTALTLSSAVYATQTYNSSKSNTANMRPAYKPCSAANNTHAAPLSLPSCSPPLGTSSYLSVSSAPPDTNGDVGPTKAIGSVQYTPIPGDPTTPQNEADIAITVKLTDVRCKGNSVPGFCSTANTDFAGLPDYSGQLNAITTTRITDDRNGPSGSDPGTVIDFVFPVTVTCTANGNTNLGSTCTVATTVNAVVPGAVVERKNTAWELAGNQVQDGGADGTAATAPNTLFETEGIWLR